MGRLYWILDPPLALLFRSLAGVLKRVSRDGANEEERARGVKPKTPRLR